MDREAADKKLNVLAISNVVFAQGGTEDQFGGNFGHLARSGESEVVLLEASDGAFGGDEEGKVLEVGPK